MEVHCCTNPQPREILHKCEVIRSHWTRQDRNRRRRMAKIKQRELSVLLAGIRVS